MIDLPKFKIGDLEINLIQGAMGVGISWEDLPIAVANCGGAGIIASVELGPLKCYKGNQIKANQDAFRETIRNARKKSNGVIGVNIMHALTDYEGLVKVATEEGVDLIISGAGMAENLPKLVGNAPINLVPIVSDVRAARIITNRYWSKYGKIPDAIIVEGPDAGGHLGFKYEDLVKGTVPSLEEIAKEVIYFANNPKNFEKPIPVIVAGEAFYRNKGFTYDANSRSEYYSLLDKIPELEKNSEEVKKILNEGSEKARVIAQETMKEVKEKIGVIL